jgi:glycosyltransferase involved in cell wall biosynthesis
MTAQRIGLISSSVPHVSGGYRFIVDWLEEQLRERGHLVETIYIPSSDEPDTQLPQMAAFRMMELDAYFDRVITFRPPAHMVRHRRKVCWFIHHIRIFYDLWEESEQHGIPNTAQYRALRDTIHAADTAALRDCHRLFANSRVVAQRLRDFNGLESEILYPPLGHPSLFTAGTYGDEVVCICRMDEHKRQHMLVEAMRFTRTPVRLRLCGLAMDSAYYEKLMEIVGAYDLSRKVAIDHRWITEEEKAELLSRSLAAAYVPFDEDSYGYPTLEAAHARRCILALRDGGGVWDFIEDGRNGLLADPNPRAVAAALDRLYADRDATIRMGEAAQRRVVELGINWDVVIGRLLA